MKLEIKHLAPYSPYDLEYFVDYEDGDTDVLIMVGFFIDDGAIYLDGYETNINSQNCKPILRPLSDLTKDEEFYNSFNAAFRNEYNIDYICECKQDISNSGLSYSCIIFLIENHFDAFGLIEKGLAIDKNKLNNNQK